SLLGSTKKTNKLSIPLEVETDHNDFREADDDYCAHDRNLFRMINDTQKRAIVQEYGGRSGRSSVIYSRKVYSKLLLSRPSLWKRRGKGVKTGDIILV